jgi:DNA-binding transcriptional MerR regulator
VPTTTLRYYEEIGLLARAERAMNGYRYYTVRDVERVRFITRAKQLRISLDELRELVTAWDGDDCQSVQFRMASVVDDRLRETQLRIAELLELADQLQLAAERLAQSPTSGGCSESCACSAASGCATSPIRTPLTLRKS